MADHDVHQDEWFAPKRFGYGAGLPLKWQGWLTLCAVVLAISGFAYIVPRLHGVVFVLAAAALLTALALLLRLSARKTRGGWRWRWGEKD